MQTTSTRRPRNLRDGFTEELKALAKATQDSEDNDVLPVWTRAIPRAVGSTSGQEPAGTQRVHEDQDPRERQRTGDPNTRSTCHAQHVAGALGARGHVARVPLPQQHRHG